ncbi:MAG: pantothenate synthase [Thelocarpon impressellum]|nr:MAG: pantothenate synthase [Thelocarpon impressellum]
MASKCTPSSIRVIRDISPIREYRRQLLRADRTVGLVPTMGALHDGHLSLIRRAAQENTDVFVSIYINPTQFGANEDLDSYPQTWAADIEKLKELDQGLAEANDAEGQASSGGRGRISAVFAPTTKTMYPSLPPSSDPAGQGSFVNITPLASLLEGQSRPTFFRGVATVCMKLFNIMTPDRVYFGQKDIQQTVVIKRMVKDFGMGVDVVVVPTSREPDGLAMSSRNVYLGKRRRKVATVLSQTLGAAEWRHAEGFRTRADILYPALQLVASVARQQQELEPSLRVLFDVDYISLADPDSLEEVDEVEDGRGAILSGAIKMLPIEKPQAGEDRGLGGGETSVRLIDNIILQPRGN